MLPITNSALRERLHFLETKLQSQARRLQQTLQQLLRIRPQSVMADADAVRREVRACEHRLFGDFERLLPPDFADTVERTAEVLVRCTQSEHWLQRQSELRWIEQPVWLFWRYLLQVCWHKPTFVGQLGDAYGRQLEDFRDEIGRFVPETLCVVRAGPQQLLKTTMGSQRDCYGFLLRHVQGTLRTLLPMLVHGGGCDRSTAVEWQNRVADWRQDDRALAEWEQRIADVCPHLAAALEATAESYVSFLVYESDVVRPLLVRPLRAFLVYLLGQMYIRPACGLSADEEGAVFGAIRSQLGDFFAENIRLT